MPSPHAVHRANVRTAETPPSGEIQQAKSDTTEHVTIELMLWMPSKYSDADEKSTAGSSSRGEIGMDTSL